MGNIESNDIHVRSQNHKRIELIDRETYKNENKIEQKEEQINNENFCFLKFMTKLNGDTYHLSNITSLAVHLRSIKFQVIDLRLDFTG